MGHTYFSEQQTKKDRNAAVYDDYNRGLSSVELVQKYQISQTRIFQIVKQAKLKTASPQ